MPLIEFKAVAQAANELLKNNGRKYFILCTQVIFGIILSQKSIKMLCHSKIGFSLVQMPLKTIIGVVLV